MRLSKPEVLELLRPKETFARWRWQITLDHEVLDVWVDDDEMGGTTQSVYEAGWTATRRGAIRAAARAAEKYEREKTT